MNDFAVILPAHDEYSRFYHANNPAINPHYKTCSVQVYTQNIFSFLKANHITQTDIITTEEDMPTTHAFGLRRVVA